MLLFFNDLESKKHLTNELEEVFELNVETYKLLTILSGLYLTE